MNRLLDRFPREEMHSPGADLDYGFDWTEEGYLEAGETIASQAWVVPAGLTTSNPAITGSATVTSTKIKGGDYGRDYLCINSIVTSSGRGDSRSLMLRCRYY